MIDPTLVGPRQCRRIPGGEVAWHVTTRHSLLIRRDICDLFQLDPDSTLALCGSVHGLSPVAAEAADLLRETVRDSASPTQPLLRHLHRINRRLLGEWVGGPTVVYATASLAVVRALAPAGLHVTTASAGQPAPLVLRADGFVERLGQRGQPLALSPEYGPATIGDVLEPGDTLILCTDHAADQSVLAPAVPTLADLLAGCAGAAPHRIAECVSLALTEISTDRCNHAVLAIRASDDLGVGLDEPIPAIWSVDCVDADNRWQVDGDDEACMSMRELSPAAA